MPSNLSLCHVFVFVKPGAPEAAGLHAAGMVESYRRRHPGQGTANVCFCFDNAFLELLWVTSEAEVTSPPIARTRLAERARWRETGACPFGIAIRTAASDGPDAPLPFATWPFAPPYLPPGTTIPVALASEDPRQPFVFRSPGSARPDAWTDGRAGTRQRDAGLAEIAGVHLRLPVPLPAGDALEALQHAGLVTVEPALADTSSLILTLSQGEGRALRRLSLPEVLWV